MKWTRITKKSLPPIDDCEDYPKEYLVRVKGDDPRSGWVYVKYETATEMQHLLQEDYAEYLDESPESSVWPGEGQSFENYPALAEVIQTIATNGLNSGSLWNKLLFEINNALQSRTAETKSLEQLQFEGEISGFKRTAVKAETRKWNEELNHWEPYAKAESQPTAGGVKEEEQWDDPAEVMILKDALKNIVSCIDNENPTHENIWRIANAALNGITCDQPSPSNDGGVKEEGGSMDMWQEIFDICKDTYPIKEATERYIEIVGILRGKPDQPSPSNPSIKRPSQDEIEKAVNEEYEGTNLKPAGIALCINAWSAAINWLLSIQSSK